MPRCMSFAMTTQAIKDRTKTVTRRRGWKFLRPGDLVWAVEKSMGLKKGEKHNHLALLRVKKNEPVALNDYSILTKQDVIAEGFPRLEPWAFVFTFCCEMGGEPDQDLNRIEFEYVPDDQWQVAVNEEHRLQRAKDRIKVPERLKGVYLQRIRKPPRGKPTGKRGTRVRLPITAKVKLLREALGRQIQYWLNKVSATIALEDAEQVFNACKPAVQNKCDLVSHRRPS